MTKDIENETEEQRDKRRKEWWSELEAGNIPFIAGTDFTIVDADGVPALLQFYVDGAGRPVAAQMLEPDDMLAMAQRYVGISRDLIRRANEIAGKGKAEEKGKG